MDLHLSREDYEFRSQFREWLSENVEPSWREKCGHDPAAEWEATQRFAQRAFRDGWAAYGWPEEYGGRPLSAVQAAIIAEERARIDAPEAGGGMPLVGYALYGFGTPAQQEHLPAIMSGEETWCLGYSEPDAGSALIDIQTRATRTGEGWRINGRKVWTSHAQFSSYCLLLARTGAREERAAGLSLFLVPMDSPGIEVRPLRQATGHAEFNEVVFDEVNLPSEALLGQENGGWGIVSAMWSRERGPAFALRHSFHLQQTFSRFLSLLPRDRCDRATIGQLYSRAFTSQLLAYELLSHQAKGAIPDGFGSVVKLYVTESWRRQGSVETQTLGLAEIEHNKVKFDDWLFDFIESMHYTISAGTSEIQRNTIARAFLRLPSSKAS